MNSEYRILIKENRVIKGGTCIPMTIPACFREDKSNFFIGEINNFKNLYFNKRLNNYGTCRFDIQVDDIVANSLISLCEYSVYIYRVTSSGDVLVWSGEQRRRTGDLKENHNDWCTIYCYDWLYALKDRYTASEVKYVDVDAGELAWYLIDTSQSTANHEYHTVDYYIGSQDNGDWTYGSYIYGQSFTGNGKELDTVYFASSKYGNPTGSVYAKIYAHSGEFGVSSMPTGSALAISDPIEASVMQQAQAFTFSGINRITLANNTHYVVMFEFPSGTSWANSVILLKDTTNPTHSGNACSGTSSNSNEDYIFIVEYAPNTIIYDKNKDFGITRGTIATTQNRDRTYNNQNIMEAIINLSDVINGFDFEITNDKVFNVYTIKGDDLTDSLILEYGRNLKNVSVDEDFTTPCNNAIVLGEVIDGTELTRVDRPDTTTQAKYKLREMVLSADNVIDENTLNAKGDAMLYKYKEPLMKITFEVIRGMIDVTQFSLGDLIRLIIKKGCYNIDSTYRIFEWTVDHKNDNTEKLSLILGELGI